jgi:PAS domain S-box-containing protein
LAENENVRTRGIDVAAELLELLPDPVIGFDTDGTVVYWSRAAEAVYGYPAAEALGRRAATLLQTRFPLPLLEITEELGDLGRWQGRLEHRRKDGRMVSVHRRWVARHDEHGARTGSFALERELDDEAAAPAPDPSAPQPPAAQRQASEGAQGEPAAHALAHELNNALAIIINYTAFVAAELDAPTDTSYPGMRADLREIQEAAERALEVTRRRAGDG